MKKINIRWESKLHINLQMKNGQENVSRGIKRKTFDQLEIQGRKKRKWKRKHSGQREDVFRPGGKTGKGQL